MTDTSSPSTEPRATAELQTESVNLPMDIDRPGDSEVMRWAKALPARTQPFLSLGRFDRPIGFWLLALPCWIGLGAARLGSGPQWIDLIWLILFGVGAIAMRGAGCTWNDIQDRDIDREVERTAGRPLPSGQVTLTEAYGFLALQLLVGFLVWLCLPLDAKIVALLAIPLVAAYPFMKRITWWPQAWLGLTFNWGVLVAFATAGSITLPAVILYLALAVWTIGYDTIYALQDREDDALIGVKSTARLFGDDAIPASFVCYLMATAMITLALFLSGAPVFAILAVAVFLGHAVWQAQSMNNDPTGDNALRVFKSNRTAGLILVAGFWMSALI